MPKRIPWWKDPPPTLPPYGPLGAARELFYCRDREVLVEGPAGTGKTRAVLEKINLCALKYPRMRALLARKTRESMSESVLATFETKVLRLGSSILDGPARRSRQSYTYPNGSVLVVSGMDKASRVMSTEFDMVAVFEGRETSEDDWESLLTRLRNNVMPYQQAIIDTNPDAPTHWINRRALAGGMTRLRSRHGDNPEVTREYLSLLDGLTGVRRARLQGGLWAACEGLVYDGYDAAAHLVARFDIPGHWRRVRSIDFGYSNPFVCQWWAIDPDGRMHLYREIYRTHRLVEDHASQIVELSAGEEVEATVADHDAEGRATLERHGVPTTPAYKAVGRGIQGVQARLREAGDGRRRLFILRGSLVEADPRLSQRRLPLCTEQEFSSYAWQPPPRRREAPADADNHGLDAMRYAAAYIDCLGRPPLGVRVY